jgi:hypothetical protein
MSPAAQVAQLIAKFDPRVAKLIRSCRAAMRKRLPTALELVYDNYNFFVIGYASSERASDAILSLASDRNGVTLFFLQGIKLPDPHKILRGSGNQVRSLRLESAATLAQPEVEALITAAVEQAKTPFPASGSRATIVKSISPKQRPRR